MSLKVGFLYATRCKTCKRTPTKIYKFEHRNLANIKHQKLYVTHFSTSKEKWFRIDVCFRRERLRKISFLLIYPTDLKHKKDKKIIMAQLNPAKNSNVIILLNACIFNVDGRDIKCKLIQFSSQLKHLTTVEKKLNPHTTSAFIFCV